MDATIDDPRSGGLGRFEETLPEDALEFGLDVEVGDAAMNGDEELGEVEVPVVLQQLQDEFGRRVERQTHKLKTYNISCNLCTHF